MLAITVDEAAGYIESFEIADAITCLKKLINYKKTGEYLQNRNTKNV